MLKIIVLNIFVETMIYMLLNIFVETMITIYFLEVGSLNLPGPGEILDISFVFVLSFLQKQITLFC